MNNNGAFLKENGVEVTRQHLRLPDGKTYKCGDLRIVKVTGPLDWLTRKPPVHRLVIGTKTGPSPKIALEIADAVFAARLNAAINQPGEAIGAARTK